jgi:hypothetical protein
VLVKRVLFLLNAALAIAILHLISQVHLPSFVKMLPKYLKDWLNGKKNKSLEYTSHHYRNSFKSNVPNKAKGLVYL